MITTPQDINAELRRFVRSMGLSGATFVPVRTHAAAVPNGCFDAVQAQCSDNGGVTVVGWQIWEWPQIMLEAEQHAVWRSPRGALFDVSLKSAGEDRIVFVEDPALTADAERRDNVRWALWDNPLVHAYFAACAARNACLEQEARQRFGPNHFGLAFSPSPHLAELQQLVTDLELRIDQALFARAQNRRR